MIVVRRKETIDVRWLMKMKEVRHTLFCMNGIYRYIELQFHFTTDPFTEEKNSNSNIKTTTQFKAPTIYKTAKAKSLHTLVFQIARWQKKIIYCYRHICVVLNCDLIRCLSVTVKENDRH